MTVFMSGSDDVFMGKGALAEVKSNSGFPGRRSDRLFVSLQTPTSPADVWALEVRGGKVEGDWTYVAETKETPDKSTQPRPFSSPEYYFEVVVGNGKARSGLLGLKARAEVKFVDHTGKPMSNVKYRVRVASGEIREGTLDAQGKAKLDNLVPGQFALKFDKKSTRKKLSRKS